MFDSVQDVLMKKGCTKLHVAYILMQLLKLCDYPVNMDELHNYKSLELAITCDAIWRDVCNALNWSFYPIV